MCRIRIESLVWDLGVAGALYLRNLDLYGCHVLVR